MVVDIYSRKIVGWEISQMESSEVASGLMERCYADEKVSKAQVTLHSDNGSPMKGATLLATLESLGVATSFNRPGVSNDNPFSESLFKSLKYHGSYPEKPFLDIKESHCWVIQFVDWYNHHHRHSGIKFLTPHQRHSGQEIYILLARHAVYEQARQKNPRRWSGKIRNWEPIGSVFLNPTKATKELL